jgi:hypothetical protein
MDNTSGLDSYDIAIQKLETITKESGWYVYCFEEEEWHLYNDDGQLLFKANTIEELAECQEPNKYILKGNSWILSNKYGKRVDDSPIRVEGTPLESYDNKYRISPQEKYSENPGND